MLVLRFWSVRHARGLGRLYEFMSRLAPLLAPLARRIGLPRTEALLRPVERMAKATLFDCRMCGQCVLGHTGMACPMNCAKQLRNGPCGGVRADGGCEVKPQMRCVWLEAGDGQRRAGSVAAPWLAPLDRRRSERSTWIQVIQPEPGAAPVTQAAPPDIPPDIRPKAPPVEPVSGEFVYVPIPDDEPNAVLQVQWDGDVARAYVGDRLVSDQFWAGRPWELDVDTWRHDLAEQPLRLEILPWNGEADYFVYLRVRHRRVPGVAAVRSATLVLASQVRIASETA